MSGNVARESSQTAGTLTLKVWSYSSSVICSAFPTCRTPALCVTTADLLLLPSSTHPRRFFRRPDHQRRQSAALARLRSAPSSDQRLGCMLERSAMAIRGIASQSRSEQSCFDGGWAHITQKAVRAPSPKVSVSCREVMHMRPPSLRRST